MKSIPEYCEIVIVDNCSSDKTVEIARKYADKIIVEKAHLCKARNIGSKAASGKVIVQLDADTVLDDSIFQEVIRKCQTAVGGVCMMYPTDGNLSHKLYYVTISLNILVLYKILTRFHIVRPYPTGGCVFFRKDAFEKTGGYDERLVSGDDVVILDKLHKIGQVVMIEKFAYTSCRRIKKLGFLKYFAHIYKNSLIYTIYRVESGHMIRTGNDRWKQAD